MWNEEKLTRLLTAPSPKLAADFGKITGDIMVLGAGGKMGPTLCLLAKNAARAAGTDRRVLAVSRFGDGDTAAVLRENGVEVICADLLDRRQLEALPEAPNIVYMAGRKFGTEGDQAATWAMNAALPAYVAQRYPSANIVVFSSGNVYPLLPLASGGADEATPPGPIGEYAMSCLARERIFEHAAAQCGSRVFIYRLNFAVDLRYGVLYDIAQKILTGQPISLATPCFNVIWQGAANEIALRALLHCQSPAVTVNVTGPETLSVEYAARRLGALLGKTPVLEGTPGADAYISNACKAAQLFGYPEVSAETLLEWQAQWILDGGRGLHKPTHFEERRGRY
jgi:dTDP-4-dehydrorhamnose reductase